MSYRELSRLTGLAPQTLHRYALGVRLPSDKSLELIAAALELEPDDLFEWRRRRVVEQLGQEHVVVDRLYAALVRHLTR